MAMGPAESVTLCTKYDFSFEVVEFNSSITTDNEPSPNPNDAEKGAECELDL